MHSAKKPWWQRATAVVSLSAGGAVTGLSFVPGTAADITSPSRLPIHLLALEQATRPASADSAALRSAIVNVTQYYLRLAATKTPAEMQAIIWQHDSIGGADHGESCAAFASLTLELAAQAVGQQSWVTGGTSYPWPLHKWADVRVEPNPASPGIISILQDARAHHRWKPLGDGYDPLPGDWVLFHGHVEVVMKYTGGILYTVGGDSLPNFSVNAHEYRAPLGSQGVIGFVDNGVNSGRAQGSPHARRPPPAVKPRQAHRNHARQSPAAHHPRDRAGAEQTAIPGMPADRPAHPGVAHQSGAAIPGIPAAPQGETTPARHRSAHSVQRQHASTAPPSRRHPPRRTGSAGAGSAGAGPAQAHSAKSSAAAGDAPGGSLVIPGLPGPASPSPLPGPASQSRPGPVPPQSAPPGGKSDSAPPAAGGHGSEQAFIAEVAPGAIAIQRGYGIPASVTIAQAIDESGWGRSVLATRDHNLFGMKGTGPAGSDREQTQEYQNGHWVTRTASFRVYHNVAESIGDYGKLLATNARYRRAMAERHNPDAFAAALTGVYATDPGYGAKLVSLMRQYDLYRYDVAAPAAPHHAGSPRPAPPRSAAPHAAGQPAAAPPRPSAAPGGPGAGKGTAGPPLPGIAGPGGARHGEPGGGSGKRGTTAPGAAASGGMGTGSEGPGGAPPDGPAVPGLPSHAPTAPTGTRRLSPAHSQLLVSARQVPEPVTGPPRGSARGVIHASTRGYQKHIPPSVMNAFVTSARDRLTQEEPLYRDVASHRGIRWELLAACDWMQCRARSHYSPVCGEKLGAQNPDGTIYRTRSEALKQCADDLADLAWAVYQVDLTEPRDLSVRDLANVFAAFRWGGLLKMHHTSAMEFPYSVAGLTTGHVSMRWPNIDDPHTPDKPGGRFRMPFGAVPIVLALDYPATV